MTNKIRENNKVIIFLGKKCSYPISPSALAFLTSASTEARICKFRTNEEKKSFPTMFLTEIQIKSHVFLHGLELVPVCQPCRDHPLLPAGDGVAALADLLKNSQMKIKHTCKLCFFAISSRERRNKLGGSLWEIDDSNGVLFLTSQT